VVDKNLGYVAQAYSAANSGRIGVLSAYIEELAWIVAIYNI
jgi:hypothetical protein